MDCKVLLGSAVVWQSLLITPAQLSVCVTGYWNMIVYAMPLEWRAERTLYGHHANYINLFYVAL